MDLWIVAAATGAGYVAKYWKNQSGDGDALSQLSFGESNLVSPQYSNHLLDKFSRRKKRFEDVFGHGRMEGTSSDHNPLDIAASVAELGSMNGFENEKLGLWGNHQDLDVLSIPNMTWKSWIDDSSKGHVGESSISNKMANDIGVLVRDSSRRIGSWRNRSTAKSRFLHGDLIKPLSSVEDCLVFRESSLSLCETKLPKGSNFDAKESVCGVSQPPFGSLTTSDIVSNKTVKGWERNSRSSNKMVKREDSASKGAPDESFILYLGFFIGIIYSFLSSKREVYKLEELLKQTEYLVQDLQEELEMKDSLKLKELTHDNCESEYTFSNAFSEKTEDGSSPKHVMDYTVNFNTEELYEHKAVESSESMSRIEAELEAELERLGLNINTQGVERFPDEDELDPEFVEDFAEGELRNDMINGQTSARTKPNEEASDSTAHSGNYTVSPRELTLRLHDVIQSRLESRIKELESALQKNQRKLQLIDTENKSSWLDLDQSGWENGLNAICVWKIRYQNRGQMKDGDLITMTWREAVVKAEG
ncbi:uncharacterized protein LOC111009000 [Momordica charantia]|uniref:Uncharacterized protein LOC111009000 n=1 Tax=Momordica charantia TaxID=3673 RepID=A0A6J1C733_MOMCH|nr:uncharacterized protein LOC111009000 [Momordica charantia]